jgi:hypothetical protein
MKLKAFPEGFMHWCPACMEPHRIWTTAKNRNGATWSFNNDMEAPSFDPSVNISWGTDGRRCHYHLTAGKLIYLTDCTHHLAGKTIPLPDFPKAQ